MDNYYIMKERRLDFENVFGPFSMWNLLSFKKLPAFWDLLVNTPINTWSKYEEKIVEFKKINQYIMKYVQGLFPV